MQKTALKIIQKFLRLEAMSSLVLLGATLAALFISNSPWASQYEQILAAKFGPWFLIKSTEHWINDGLMAVFFFLVGLEIKREVLIGELADRRTAMLPALGAIGGMALPAAIFVAINWFHPQNLQGWAIPSATDIAFALGTLGLLGNRIPLALKIFLLALAILDDLGAILIIAIFYTADLNPWAFAITLPLIGLLALLNQRNINHFLPYLIVGLALWLAVLHSGIHATVAGVVVALFIPLRTVRNDQDSLAGKCEAALHGLVAYLIMPVFAFANAGLALTHLTWTDVVAPLSFAIAAGLFFGKQIGIMAAITLGHVFGWCRLPTGVTWLQLYGVAILAGIGFTMSLFIGTLAFNDPVQLDAVRLGVLTGTLCSAAIGYLLLRLLPSKIKSRDKLAA